MNPIQKIGHKATRAELNRIYEAVWERDKGVCQICNSQVHFEQRDFHHIVPRGRIRMDDPRNFVLCHNQCHRNIHDGIWMSVDDLIEKKKDQLEELYNYRVMTNGLFVLPV